MDHRNLYKFKKSNKNLSGSSTISSTLKSGDISDSLKVQTFLQQRHSTLNATNVQFDLTQKNYANVNHFWSKPGANSMPNRFLNNETSSSKPSSTDIPNPLSHFLSKTVKDHNMVSNRTSDISVNTPFDLTNNNHTNGNHFWNKTDGEKNIANAFLIPNSNFASNQTAASSSQLPGSSKSVVRKNIPFSRPTSNIYVNTSFHPSLQPPPSPEYSNLYQPSVTPSYSLPNGIHQTYPNNFSSLRFNGSRLLKTLNWMDSEIIQIIEDILDHDISVAAALNRIYYITGDRPSLRIFQQRVRRFREQRNKDAQKNGRKSILKRKYISSKEIKAFYDRFENLSMPSTSTLKEGGNQFERIECKKFENLNELSSNNATAAVSSAPTSYFDDIFYHSNHDSIQNVQLQEFNSFKRNQNFDQNFENNSNQIATTAGNVLMTEASAEEKDSTTKLETSEIDCILQNLCYSGPVYPDNNNNNASNINSKIDAQKTFQSLPPSTNDKFNNAPILTPLDPLEHHQNNATDWSNAASNINKTSYFNINQQQQNSSITTLPPPPPPPPTTQYSTFLNSTISSSTTTFKANSIQPQISSSPIFLSSNELLFDDIGGIITAQKINALIDEIDPEWIQKLLDESDESMDAIFGDENDATKIIKPKKMKNLCINIENILNFMNLSISVYLHHSKINIFDQKIWKSFGTSLNDLIKLKDIYEAFEDENSSAIVNRTIFVHDVMNWICGAFDGGIGNEEAIISKIPNTNLNVKQFQRFIDFLKKFISKMFDYSTNYEILYNDLKMDSTKVAKLSSVLANCVLIITDIVSCVAIIHEIEDCQMPFLFANL